MKAYGYLLLLAALLLMPSAQSDLISALTTDGGLWCEVHTLSVSLLGGRALECVPSTLEQDKIMYVRIARNETSYMYCEQATCWHYDAKRAHWKVYSQSGSIN